MRVNRKTNPQPIEREQNLRFALHVSRFTSRAPRFNASTLQRFNAFTLIELLVVISVIAILASLVFPVTGAVRASGAKARARAELAQIETAIQRYKEKRGHYPPDNPNDVAFNQLYYELLGTTLSNGVFQTLDGSAQISQALVQGGAFGPNVKGFVNSSSGSGGDEGTPAANFLPGLKPGQIGQLNFKGAPVKLLVGIPWQQGPAPEFNFDPIAGAPTLNPWRYNSSAPLNNPNSYDLWIEINVGGKVFLICNWSKQPLRITKHDPYLR
jgi:prepilin-type N-terminal cleavage/methylation domain-containing protein